MAQTATVQLQSDPKLATIEAVANKILTRVNQLQTTAEARALALGLGVKADVVGAAVKDAAAVEAITDATEAATIAALDAKFTAGLAGVSAQVSELAAAVAKLGTAQPQPPVVNDWPMPEDTPANSLYTVTAGAKIGSSLAKNPGLHIKGAGMRLTTVDDLDQRLKWGKGQVLVAEGALDVLVEDIGFIHAGSGGHDGEAGVYCETGSVTVRRCAFDDCENGVYSMPREYNGRAFNHLTVDKCVFGRIAANGKDPGAHDIYSGSDIVITDSVFAGNSRANTIKVRANKLDISRSWVGRRHGRFIDLPGGTIVRSEGNTYVTLPGAGSNNAMGFYNEGNPGNNSDGFGDALFDGDTFVFGPRWREVFWVGHPEAKVVFRACNVFWYGDTAPLVIFSRDADGNDVIADFPHPFVFNERNRISGPPVMPADPA